MHFSSLAGKRVAVWGAGREGLAAREYLLRNVPGLTMTLVDEAARGARPAAGDDDVVTDPSAIRRVLADADVIVKSPGVSLCHPLVEEQRARGTPITSLLNLWFCNESLGCVITVTGTKGKSTTSTLLCHVLNGLGRKAAVLGNIGVPVSEVDIRGLDCIVVEVSSYQAADFSGRSNLGILTSLYPEHIDWHGSLDAYFAAKANLLNRSQLKLVEAAALETLRGTGIALDDAITFNSPEGFHFQGDHVVDPRGVDLGPINSAFLNRQHNRSNVCAVLCAIDKLGLDAKQALLAMASYEGLPHRQQELGERDGVLYVDDSISTIPQSAIAALEAFSGRPRTIILGGFDRGVDHAPILQFAGRHRVSAFVCLGQSGQRLFSELQGMGCSNAYLVASMQEAVAVAKAQTPRGGVILLSPGASSFGMFRDYVDRADAFRRECGF